MLKIISVPNKILSSSTKRVSVIDEKIKKLVVEMEKTLAAQTDPPGVGLAANQIGENLSLFIIKPSEKAKIKVFINPKILKSETRNPKSETNPKSKNQKKKPVKLEGCLSIPRVWGPVRRANRILLEYHDLTLPTDSGLPTGRQVKRGWFQGFEAAIIQHEIDHLNGVVFTQRSLEQNQKVYREEEGELKEIEI